MADKILMVVNANEVSDVDVPVGMAYIRAIAKRLGYRTDTIVAPEGASTIFDDVDVSEYAWACVFHMKEPIAVDDSIRQVIDGSFGLTTFVVQYVNGGGFANTDLDCNFAAGAALSHYKLNWRGHDLWCFSRDRPLLGNKTTEVIVADTTGTGAHIWKVEGATSNVYASSYATTFTGVAMLPIMLQEAIDNGDIEAPPKRAATYWDVDHMPTYSTTMEDNTKLYDLMVQYNWPMSWGLTTGTDSPSQPWVNTPDDQKAFVAARTPDKGGLIYAISHNHEWHWDIRDDDLYTSVSDKASMQAQYDADVAKCVAAGISIGWNTDQKDAWGYVHCPSNRHDDVANQVSSENGITTARLDVFSGTVLADVIGISGYDGAINMRRGVRFLNSKSRLSDNDPDIFITPDSADELLAFSIMMSNWLIDGMAVGASQYVHDTNLWHNHSGVPSATVGNAPAYKCYVQIGAIAAELKDVHQFSHPSKG